MLIWILIGSSSLALFLIFLAWTLAPSQTTDGANVPPRVQVLVLGDIGRSPRMQNHALSLLKAGAMVDLIGYLDSELHPKLANQPQVRVYGIAKTPQLLHTKSRSLFVIFGPLKVLRQLWSLSRILAYRTEPAKWLLVQNPPSIPTLVVAAVVCRLRKTGFAIDWHNYGYSILALRLGPDHPLVKLSYVYERWLSHAADVNFTVSEAMRRQLQQEFKITAPLKRLYDRPNAEFQPASAEERREFLRSRDLWDHLTGVLPTGNFKVVVSSTSWTPDEDFSILLDALVGYSKAGALNSQLPQLLVIITGKGPQKEMYLQKIAQLESESKLGRVTIKTAWLPTYGYASLLASAELGISLHQSSSGVDLPMKVVDMFGAGLPVAGWGAFEAWPELVKEGVNGRSFGSAGELQVILLQLFGEHNQQLTKLRDGVLQERRHDWDAEWQSSAGDAFGLGK